MYDHVDYLDPGSTFSVNGIGDKLRHYSSYSSTIGVTANSFTAGSNLYEIGDVLPVANEDLSYRGSLRLPVADDGGFCQDLDVIHFGRDKMKRQCARVVSDLSSSSLCVTSFNVDHYVKDLFVGGNRLSSSSSESNLEDNPSFVRVSYGSFEDSDGNFVNLATTAPPVTIWNDGASECENALKALRYNIVYNDSGGIEQVNAHVQVANIKSDVSTVYQEFAVEFTKINSNHTSRVKSGNPGYIFGAPVLSGISAVDPDGMERIQMTPSSGLSTMDAGDCEAISTTGNVSSKVKSVDFFFFHLHKRWYTLSSSLCYLFPLH